MEGALWLEARDALAGIADVAGRYDADGVDIHFLNNPSVGRGMKVRQHLLLAFSSTELTAGLNRRLDQR